MPLPIWSVSSGVMVSKVISDAYTPGAMAFTRIGIPLSANSVSSIFVRCEAAAFALL